MTNEALRLQGQPAARQRADLQGQYSRRATGARSTPRCLPAPLRSSTLSHWKRPSPAAGSRHLYQQHHLRALNRPSIAPHSDQPDNAASSAPSTTRPICSSGWTLAEPDASPPDCWTAGYCDAVRRPTSTTTPRASAHCIDYDNGVETTYAYDPLTFRLDPSARPARCRLALNGLASQPSSANARLTGPEPALHLRPGRQHHPDRATTALARPSTSATDASSRTADYTYDAVYRLIEATGREHIGQVGGLDSRQPAATTAITPSWDRRSPTIGRAMRNYTERYAYDAVGNFERMHPPAATGDSWTRAYAYNEDEPDRERHPGTTPRRATA